MPGEVLVVDRLSKTFGTRPALSGISFELRAGEAVAYLGPNGAGKTTTLKILVGLLRPDHGSVRVLGRLWTGAGRPANSSVGALLETPGIVGYLTGRDWLRYAVEVRGLPTGEQGTEIERVAKATHVDTDLDRPMGTLSTGLLRRLLLSSALVGRPSVLLLDEPTLGLDPAARQDLRAMLRSLRSEGTTILLSTHILEDVEEVCDRVLFLREGRLVGDEPVRSGPSGGGTNAPRRSRFDFLAEPDARHLRSQLSEGERIENLRGRSAEISLIGGDLRQAELVAAFASGSPGLVSVERLDDDLTRRYLELVGREDPA